MKYDRRKFVVYPIKEGDKSTFGIVEYDRNDEMVGRYGIYVGPASHTDLFRAYAKFISDKLEDDEKAFVQTFHQVIISKAYGFPKCFFQLKDGVKRYSYCRNIARAAQLTQTNIYETIKMEEL